MAFFVIGGVYADTSFSRLAPGETEQRHGPFQSWKEAHATWERLARRTIDDAHARFHIVDEAGRSVASDPAAGS
ncbi:MAG: hypothetical protein OHK0024_12660 [Thalassobaculales bacterium]